MKIEKIKFSLDRNFGVLIDDDENLNATVYVFNKNDAYEYVINKTDSIDDDFIEVYMINKPNLKINVKKSVTIHQFDYKIIDESNDDELILFFDGKIYNFNQKENNCYFNTI